MPVRVSGHLKRTKCQRALTRPYSSSRRWLQTIGPLQVFDFAADIIRRLRQDIAFRRSVDTARWTRSWISLFVFWLRQRIHIGPPIHQAGDYRPAKLDTQLCLCHQAADGGLYFFCSCYSCRWCCCCCCCVAFQRIMSSTITDVFFLQSFSSSSSSSDVEQEPLLTSFYPPALNLDYPLELIISLGFGLAFSRLQTIQLPKMIINAN